jgi:hypothetical protein
MIFAARIEYAGVESPDALDILRNTEEDVIHIVQKLIDEYRNAKTLEEHADDAIDITRGA